MTYGATPLREGGVQFRVWAPNVKTLAVKIWGAPEGTIPLADARGSETRLPSRDRKGAVTAMTRAGEDFEVYIPDARPGDRYSFVLDGERERPDPVSRLQPHGVRG